MRYVFTYFKSILSICTRHGLMYKFHVCVSNNVAFTADVMYLTNKWVPMPIAVTSALSNYSFQKCEKKDKLVMPYIVLQVLLSISAIENIQFLIHTYTTVQLKTTSVAPHNFLQTIKANQAITQSTDDAIVRTRTS